MSFLLKWLVMSFAVWATAKVLPGVRLRSATSSVLIAALFGLLNFLIGWLLFAIIGLGTLGLGYVLAFITWWIVNAILLKLVSGISRRFEVTSFGWALAASAGISLFNALGTWVINLILA